MYKEKFKQRKLLFLDTFGTVDLVLDKKYSFKLSTGQATAIFHIESKPKGISNNELADYMNMESSLVRKMIHPIIDSSILWE